MSDSLIKSHLKALNNENVKEINKSKERRLLLEELQALKKNLITTNEDNVTFKKNKTLIKK